MRRLPRGVQLRRDGREDQVRRGHKIELRGLQELRERQEILRQGQLVLQQLQCAQADDRGGHQHARSLRRVPGWALVRRKFCGHAVCRGLQVGCGCGSVRQVWVRVDVLGGGGKRLQDLRRGKLHQRRNHQRSRRVPDLPGGQPVSGRRRENRMRCGQILGRRTRSVQRLWLGQKVRARDGEQQLRDVPERADDQRGVHNRAHELWGLSERANV